MKVASTYSFMRPLGPTSSRQVPPQHARYSSKAQPGYAKGAAPNEDGSRSDTVRQEPKEEQNANVYGEATG